MAEAGGPLLKHYEASSWFGLLALAKLVKKGEKTELFKLMERHDRTRLTSGIWSRALEHGDDVLGKLCGSIASDESRHEIDQLEETWRDAVLKGNIAALEPLLADDYMAISPNGTLQSKEQTLAYLRAGAIHFAAIEFSDRKVRFYGTTALVTSRAEVSGANPEVVIDGSFRYTRVYVRDVRGNWKIVSFEASRIREPGEPR